MAGLPIWLYDMSDIESIRAERNTIGEAIGQACAVYRNLAARLFAGWVDPATSCCATDNGSPPL